MSIHVTLGQAAQRICQFNRKLSYGRLGPASLSSSATDEDIRNQASLVSEERAEFAEAVTVENALKEAIDCLVVEVWLEVLCAAHAPEGLSIDEAILIVVANYERPAYVSEAGKLIQIMAWLGCDVKLALLAVLDDNEDKFHSRVEDCAATTRHWTDNNTPCTAKPVDSFSREWGVFRDSDLKLLKPRRMLIDKEHGTGLCLGKFCPTILWAHKLVSMNEVLKRSKD